MGENPSKPLLSAIFAVSCCYNAHSTTAAAERHVRGERFYAVLIHCAPPKSYKVETRWQVSHNQASVVPPHPSHWCMQCIVSCNTLLQCNAGGRGHDDVDQPDGTASRSTSVSSGWALPQRGRSVPLMSVYFFFLSSYLNVSKSIVSHSITDHCAVSLQVRPRQHCGQPGTGCRHAAHGGVAGAVCLPGRLETQSRLSSNAYFDVHRPCTMSLAPVSIKHRCSRSYRSCAHPYVHVNLSRRERS